MEEQDISMGSSSDTSDELNMRQEPQCRTTYKFGLDLHYVTSNIISMAAPSVIDDESTIKESWSHSKINEYQSTVNHDDSDCSISETSERSGPLHHRDSVGTLSGPQSPTESPLNSDVLSSVPTGCSLSEDSCEWKRNDKHKDANTSSYNLKKEVSNRRNGNCPKTISEYLNSNHRDHHLLFNISGNEPCTQTQMILDNQIVNLPWVCPGINYSDKKSDEVLPHCPTAASIPTLNCLLDICYALNAFIKLDKGNIVVVYCSNGKTRTGIAIAAYLKYSGVVHSALDGFRMFCSRTCQKIVNMEEIDGLIPPSLKTLFRNFDTYLECGEFPRQSKLLLHAVTLQGVPVDDLPRIDIFDDQGLIYSSHLEVQDNNIKESDNDLKQNLMWADEEGFYRVNKPVMGDFLTLVRFGGDYAQDTNDPTKVILRYANNTAFLYPATLELPKNKVDIMRRYSDSVDSEDFLVTFIFDDWKPEQESNIEENTSEFPQLLLWGKDALYRGLFIINTYHAVDERSSIGNLFESDSIALQNYYHGSVGAKLSHNAIPSVLLLHLALKLSNGDLFRAVNEFLECKMKYIWKMDSSANIFSRPVLKGESGEANLSAVDASDHIDIASCHSRSVEGCDINVLHVVNKSCLLPHSPSERSGPLTTKYSPQVATAKTPLNPFQLISSSQEGERFRTSMMYGKVEKVIGLNTSFVESFHGSSKKCDPSAAMDLMMHILNESVREHELLALYENPAISLRQSPEKGIVDNSTFERPMRTDLTSPNAEMEYFENCNFKTMFGFESKLHQPLDSDRIESKFGAALSPPLPIKIASHIEINGLIISKDTDYVYIRVPQKDLPDEKLTECKTLASGPYGKNTNSKVLAIMKISETPDKQPEFNESSANKEPFKTANSHKNESIMDLDPNKSLKSQQSADVVASETEDSGPALKDDPEYTKYFKMLKMGLPIGAVKNALQRDGRDPLIMDLDPNKSLKSQLKKPCISETKEKKIKVRRKKIYWNAIDKSKVRKDSIWGQIMGMVNLEKLDYDANEFESLFTESLDPSQKKADLQKRQTDGPKQKKSVQVIDGKRGMNGGIILARLKMNFKEMAHIIDYM